MTDRAAMQRMPETCGLSLGFDGRFFCRPAAMLCHKVELCPVSSGVTRVIPSSPCGTCTTRCKGDTCPRWQRWFSASWRTLQEMFVEPNSAERGAKP